MRFFATNPQGASLMTRMATNFPLVFVLIREIRGRFLMPPQVLYAPPIELTPEEQLDDLMQEGYSLDVVGRCCTISNHTVHARKLPPSINRQPTSLMALSITTVGCRTSWFLLQWEGIADDHRKR